MHNGLKKLFLLLLSLAIFTLPASCAAKNSVKISLAGVSPQIKTNILAQLSLHNLPIKEELSNQHIDSLYEKASDEILEAIEPFGYYDVKVTPSLEFDIDKQGNYQWHATFTITLGEPITIHKINFAINGSGVQEKDVALSKIKVPAYLTEGNILRHSDYEEAKYEILTAVVDLGYINANWQQRKVVVNREKHSCEIFLTVDTDKLFHFGEINIAKSNLSQQFIHKYINLRYGERFSPSKIIKVEQNLAGSGYFSGTSINQAVNPNSTYLNLDFKPALLKKNKFSAGLGYATDEGPRGAIAWHRRYLNSSGHNFQANAYVSPLYQLAKIKYNIPGNNPITTKYYTGILADQNNNSITLNDNSINNFVTKSSKLDFGQEYKYNNFTRKISLNAMWSSTTQYITPPGINPIIATYPYHDSFLIYPQIKFTTNWINEKTSPHHGIKAEISVIAGSNNITDLNNKTPTEIKYFAQIQGKYKQLFALSKKLNFLLKGEIGMTFPDDNKLPDNLLFLTGGDNSLRGYHYKTIGELATINNQPTVIGTNYLYLLTIEAQVNAYHSAYLFGFFDAGNASHTFSTDIKRDFGIGVLFDLSIGMIKCSIAIPLDKPTIIPTTPSNFRLNLNFEQDF